MRKKSRRWGTIGGMRGRRRCWRWLKVREEEQEEDVVGGERSVSGGRGE